MSQHSNSLIERTPNQYTTVQCAPHFNNKGMYKVLPFITVALLAGCAVAGLILGIYDIAYTSVNLELPRGPELLMRR